MRLLTIWTFSLLLFSHVAWGQIAETEMYFNGQKEVRAGIGFSITSFSSNFTYLISPEAGFRYHRHWFGLSPFYGRMDALAGQQDIGVGINYRLYPFQNLTSVRAYLPAGVHYNYKWSDRVSKNAMFYKVGFGAETTFGSSLVVSLDADLGIGQTLTTHGRSGEMAPSVQPEALSYYFMPIIKLSYILP